VASPKPDQINLVVSDMDAAVAFYPRLGLKIPDTDPSWQAHHRRAELNGGLDLDVDSEKFAEIVRRGTFDHSTGERVLHEAHAVIEQIERWDPPFSEPWPDWSPDMRWPVPGLVEGWDEAKCSGP
jgi:catechol 2,3-dioxygenase-like lactoylglutathione lyase family enzyme